VAVTVVIPAFNAERLLTATLDSLALQAVQPDRVIVVDDGSSDATSEVARSHVLNPEVVQQQHAGPAAARNHGAFLAETEWIAYLDQDDLWHRRHLQLALGTAERSGADLISSRTVSFVLEDGSDPGPRARWADIRVTPDELEAELVKELAAEWDFSVVDSIGAATTGLAPTPSTVLVRRHILARAGGFPALFDTPNDVACYYAISRIGSIVKSAAPTTYYRIHAGAMSELGSESEVTNLAAFVAMWYGNDLTPHRVAEHRAALAEFGRSYGSARLKFLLAHATGRGSAWRLTVERAFEDLLVADADTRRSLRRIRAKRRFEIALPRAAGLSRSVVRFLRSGD
jgi:GT2 family glycosyltransferase